MTTKTMNVDLEKEMQVIFSELDVDLQKYLMDIGRVAHFAEQAAKKKYTLSEQMT